jgi:HPt (histidine-containing phosphotransfer) domain-containing protein
MNDFVVKPARKKELVEAILRVMPTPVPAIDRLPEGAAPPLAGATDASSSKEPAFDPLAFEELATEIGEEAASEVRIVFIDETASRLTLFRQLSIETDGKRISREAHSLKSAAGTFGYRRLASLAMQLKKNAARLTGSDYRELLGRIDAAYAEGRAQDVREAQH